LQHRFWSTRKGLNESRVGHKEAAKTEAAKAAKAELPKAAKRRKADGGRKIESGIMSIKTIEGKVYLVDEWNQRVECLGEESEFNLETYLASKSRRPRRLANQAAQ
jgi:hypothetical protein